MIASVNPATGETLRVFAALSEPELAERLQRAADAFAAYRHTSLAERAGWMARAAELLQAEAHPLARTMTLEMGKPVGAALAEVEKCAWVCRYYAEHAERFLADEPVALGEGRARVKHQPLGPVLAVMPWNFPLWQVFRFAAPALMAGNVGLLKHASNVPQCALAIERIFGRAGFPAGAFQTLLVGADAVERVIADARVRAATLTGSEGAGRAVGAATGRALKPSVLELGGSDPFVVLPSADLEAAARTAVQARTLNNGQSCIAAKRFILHREIADAFTRRFVERMRALQQGDPLDPAVEIGPLATAAIRDEVHEQVRRSVEAGATLLLGGELPAGPGWFYPPTVLADVPLAAPAACEEVFGPVAALFRVADLDEAIRVANASPYGLGSSAWTRDPAEQRRLADELEAGSVFLNAMVSSDPRLPFGGIKNSGYGRELARQGILAFVNVKTVRLAAEAGGEPKATE